MKSTFLSIIIYTICSLNLLGQNLSADLQEQITSLSEGESFEMKYVKRGCWGTYEGGGIIFKLVADSVEVKVTNQQVYLGSEAQTTSSHYQVDELLQTLEENKKTFVMDDTNIVLANSFEYRLEQNDKEVASGSSSLEPGDVVNKVALSNSLRDSFLGKQKRLLRNSGVIKGSGINN